jgi:DNA repair protein RecO (recombination protein O)
MGPPQLGEALILRSRLYGESDKIVTFLTANAGKLTGIAKGAKNSKRRFANCLEPFTRVRVHYRLPRQGTTLVFMESCDLLRPVSALAEPAKLAYGSYLVELVDLLTEEAHPVAEVYRLLDAGLDILEHGPATAAFLRSFEMQLLCDAGYEPRLLQCGRCQKDIDAEADVYFDPTHGSVVCRTCGNANQSLVSVSGASLRALEELKRGSLVTLREQRFTRQVANDAAQLMGYLLAQHLPRPLRSLKLIAALTA